MFVEISNVYGAPAPPDTTNGIGPSGGVEGFAGVNEMPGVTVIVATATLPSESFTCTLSVTPPVDPAT